ncbi:MAG: hypothetical protein U0736_21015 [Gemmataceae bacterium]
MRHPILAALSLVLLASTPVAGAALDPVGGAVLDRATFAQWVDGAETPIPEQAARGGPRAVVWAAGGQPDWPGVRFGDGRAVGVRHLRIGFTEPVAVGSVLVRGGGTLSVLKADAAYPGNLADDTQWVTAERLVSRQVTRREVDREGYAVWVLPAGTRTRALRFSHTPSPGDRELAGWLGGVWVLAGRYGNVAPQAVVRSVARDDVGARLVDESNNNQWQTWDNGEKGAAAPISAAHPETVTLTWPKPVALAGVCLLWTGFSAVRVEAFTGRAGDNLHDATDASWTQVAERADMDALYPLALGSHWLAFDRPTVTRSIRLKILKGAISGHPHLADKVKEGRRVWLGELMAVAPLAADGGLTSLVLPVEREEPPPIPVRFTLPEAGVVTLVIEDERGRRVRNLVSETPFPAGDNVAWWDGSDDLLRDPDAARHGVYHIPTRPVAPGTYKVRGLWRRPLQLRYEFSVYNAGKPAWETADRTGCWLTTHTPPTSVAVVPAARTADGQPLVFLGAYVAEGRHGCSGVREDEHQGRRPGVGGRHLDGGAHARRRPRDRASPTACVTSARSSTASCG